MWPRNTLMPHLILQTKFPLHEQVIDVFSDFQRAWRSRLPFHFYFNALLVFPVCCIRGVSQTTENDYRERTFSQRRKGGRRAGQCECSRCVHALSSSVTPSSSQVPGYGMVAHHNERWLVMMNNPPVATNRRDAGRQRPGRGCWKAIFF